MRQTLAPLAMYVRNAQSVSTEGADSHMIKKLTKTGNSLALVIDKPLLDRLGLDAETPVEVSTDGEVIIISRVRDKKRSSRIKAIVEEAHREYGGVFRRLAE